MQLIDFKSKFNKLVRKDGSSTAQLKECLESSIVLQSLLLAKLNRDKQQINSLADMEFSGFSQWGEDGILDWIINKMPVIPDSFIEFGVGDYHESNTRLLLYLRNWRGLVMDGSIQHIENIKKQDIFWKFDLAARQAFIDRDNINNLIASAGFSGEIGLLSVDIDGNDYWVWQAIEVVNPIIVVCEYNSLFGDINQVSIPYQQDFQRTHAHYSNLYFGASLSALIGLGDQKGYRFVGTNSSGCNAFFVRRDHAPLIIDAMKKVSSFPSRFRESRDVNGQLSYAAGLQRIDAIRNLPVCDFASGKVCPIVELGELYSNEWLRHQ